jgi:hypothetical protein
MSPQIANIPIVRATKMTSAISLPQIRMLALAAG